MRRLDVEPAPESDRAPLVVVVVEGGMRRWVSSALPVCGARIVPEGPDDRKRRDRPVREPGWAEGAGGWTVMFVIPTAGVERFALLVPVLDARREWGEPTATLFFKPVTRLYA